MKNFSNENNIIKKNGKIFAQSESKKTKIDNNKQIIITESSQISNNLNKFNKNNVIISNKIRIIIIIIYFAIVIWEEFFYRDYLFKKSILIQENFQKNEKNMINLKIFEIISKLGGELSTLFIFAIIFLLMPLNYSFLILQSIIYSSYLTNTLKMLYQSDRPNWHSEYLTFSCNYGYGNPSGHSLTSITLYLSLSHILITYFKIKTIYKGIIFIIFIILSLLIIISRVILAVHSINQVIYGFTLGMGLYYILIYAVGYHKYSSIQFLQHIRKKKVNYVYYFLHIFLLIATILVYIFINSKDTSIFETNIFNGIRCKIKNPYLKYKNDGLFQSLSITSLIGAQLGINILLRFLKKQNYMIGVSFIEWNKSKNIKNFFLRFVVIIFSSFGIILYYLIPKDFPLLLIFIFKSGTAFFLGMLGIHLIGIYLCIYLKIANIEIYKMDVLHEITSSA